MTTSEIVSLAGARGPAGTQCGILVNDDESRTMLILKLPGKDGDPGYPNRWDAEITGLLHFCGTNKGLTRRQRTQNLNSKLNRCVNESVYPIHVFVRYPGGRYRYMGEFARLPGYDRWTELNGRRIIVFGLVSKNIAAVEPIIREMECAVGRRPPGAPGRSTVAPGRGSNTFRHTRLMIGGAIPARFYEGRGGQQHVRRVSPCSCGVRRLSWTAREGRDACIICGERPGRIATRDGPVCGGCMPADLLEGAEALGVHRIMTYLRMNPGCPRCPDVAERPGERTACDRSMAITSASHVMLYKELERETATAEEVLIVVSFIKSAGLNLIIDGLRAHARSRPVRVITTAYMGATEYEAVQTLMDLPNTELRMELCGRHTRLHAKCFMFLRGGGASTAYVGSANISRTALTTGEEWVVRIREQDLPEVIQDLREGFAALWRSPDVRRVARGDRAEIERALEFRGNRRWNWNWN